MAPPLLKARARLAAAAVVLIAAVALLHYDIPPVPTWFYVLAWYPTLVILDQVVVLLGGESLLARPPELAAMLWWSAVIWLLFEAINFRLQNWYYVFLPPQRLDRGAAIVISLAAVVPAVLLPERLLDRLGVWHALRARPIQLAVTHLRAAWRVGWAMLALVLGFPRYLYPLTWGAVWLVAEPLLYRRDPQRSLLGDIARGAWGRIARLMTAGLVAGALWESFNAMARGRWIYTVPFLEHWKIFEMPPAGFIGFPFFALEVWSLYHLLAPRTTRRVLLGTAAFALLVLAGIDRWTVSSTPPQLADLPGVTPGVRQRLRSAGWDAVFRVARTPVAELAYRANVSPGEARAARDAARLVTLRGIGSGYAATLMASGIGSVAALAAADPDTVWRRGGSGPRPTPPQGRGGGRAAPRGGRAPARRSGPPPPPPHAAPGPSPP